MFQALDRLFRSEAAGGILLVLATVLAILIANSGLAPFYTQVLSADLAISAGDAGLEKPIRLWINDGLMALFFFLVGLELKRELLEGKLRQPRDVVLPGMAAVGGMALPAVIFATLNWGNAATIDGWAIPAATDIAFALGILALLGDRVPSALRVFLLTIAILDDIGAIIIIALFYTADLQLLYLAIALIPFAVMLWFNFGGVTRVAPTLFLGLLLWFLMLKSDVHATLAGVVTAFCIPLTDRHGGSPLHRLEDGLWPYVFFFVIPLFAFANAGVTLADLSLADLLAPLPLGIALGLILGKQLGVFGVTWVMVKTGLARLPAGLGWRHVYGAACLAGIGFTMSLFIGSLSYTSQEQLNAMRLGVLAGSAVSGVLGCFVLGLGAAARSPDSQWGQAE